jgi:hypothetical protein
MNTQSPEIPVFPNPANGNLVNVDLRDITGIQPISYTIYNLLGATVKQDILRPGMINQLNLSGIKPGMYFISISNRKFSSTQKLLIK